MAEDKDYGQKGQGKGRKKNPERSNTSGSGQNEPSRHHGLGSVDEDLQQHVSNGRLGQGRSRQDQPDLDSGTSHKGESSRKRKDQDPDSDPDFGGNRKTSTGQVGSDIGANRNKSDSDSTDKNSGNG